MADRISGQMVLAGEAGDYRDPGGAVIHMITRLIREYEAAGGDLHNLTIHSGREKTDRVGRGRLSVRLMGVKDEVSAL